VIVALHFFLKAIISLHTIHAVVNRRVELILSINPRNWYLTDYLTSPIYANGWHEEMNVPWAFIELYW